VIGCAGVRPNPTNSPNPPLFIVWLLMLLQAGEINREFTVHFESSSRYCTLARNAVKCWPIFDIFHSIDSTVNTIRHNLRLEADRLELPNVNLAET